MTRTVRAVFNQFDNLTSEEFAQLLRMAKLSSEDKEIATRIIVWRMAYIDTGVVVHMDRRTVARRMENIILPELVRIAYRLGYISAGA